MVKVVALLKPFHALTKVVEDERMMVSEVIPMVMKLHHDLGNMDGHLVGTLQLELLDKTETYFTTGIRTFKDIEEQEMFTLATLLDPRYKMAGFRDRHKAVEAKGILVDKAVEIAERETRTESTIITVTTVSASSVPAEVVDAWDSLRNDNEEECEAPVQVTSSYRFIKYNQK